MLDDSVKAQLDTYFDRISQPIEIIASLDDSPAAALVMAAAAPTSKSSSTTAGT